MLNKKKLSGQLAAWALPLAREGTGRISRAHLECAAGGEGAGAVHEMIAEMLLPGTDGGAWKPGEKDIAGRLGAVAAIGHTSGWDALAGAAAAIFVICHHRS